MKEVASDGRADFPFVALHFPADDGLINFLHLPAGEL